MAIRIPKYPTKADKRGRIRIKFRGQHYNLPGPIGSKESLAEYARLIAEWSADKPRLILCESGLTISELIAAYLKADPRGLDHPQVARVARACVPLDRLFGATQANDFTAARLGVVQEAMINRSWGDDADPWGRNYINAQIKNIRRVFRWAEFKGFIGAGKWEHLRTCPPVSRHHPGVTKPRPRQAVDWGSQVKPALAFVSPQISVMLQLQYLMGCRPSEVLNMRRCEIDRDSVRGVWLFRPTHHKMDGEGAELIKAIGPQGQALLAPWMLMSPADDCPIFRPASNSHRPYGPEGYAAAVRRACERAGVKPWTPYQLRHTRRRDVTREFDLEAARATLGHVTASMTAEYAKGVDVEIIAKVARKIG